MKIQKLRIVVGSVLVEKYKHDSDLPNVHVTNDVLIQTNGDVDVIREKGDMRAVFFGRITGLRDASGLMTAARKSQPSFNAFLATKSIEECIQRLEGRFILLQLGKNNSLEVGCDRFGQMDLYYQKTADGVVFGTDLSLLPFQGAKVEYDPIAVAHALHIYGFRPAKKDTLYKGVKRLGVGEIANWKNGQFTLRQIAPNILPTREYGEKELTQYSEILLDAVAQRSSPDSNVVYLSSGWDSTAILACLVKLHGPKKVRGVIGRLNFSQRSGVNNPFEIERAQKVADYFGVPLEVVETDWSQKGPEMLERWRPFMQSHMLSSMAFFTWAAIAEHVAKTTKGNEALFSGEMSDGSHNLGFSQFTTIFHPVLEFREYSDKMASYLFGPTFLKSLQNGTYKNDAIYNLLKQKFQSEIFDDAVSKPADCTLQLFSSFFLRNGRFPLLSIKNSNMLTQWGGECYTKEMEKKYLEQPATNATLETLYSWYLHLYNSFHWQGGTVATLALTADACGLEMNLPFRDSRMQEFLSAMPESWGRGLDLKPTKYPLKWMLENKINYPLHLQVGPHSYLYDVNPNFNHAGEFIYASQFTPAIKKSMSEGRYKRVLSPEIFDSTYFDRIVSNYLGNKEVVPERTDLSALAFLSLAGWYGA